MEMNNNVIEMFLMDGEEYKPVKGYEEKYFVTSRGRVWSTYRNMWLTLVPAKDDYRKVNLYLNGKMKTYQVHRLVAAAFIDNPDNLPEINHKNEIRYDNVVENLEWCTHVYNLQYGNRNKKISEAHIKRHQQKKEKNNELLCS